MNETTTTKLPKWLLLLEAQRAYFIDKNEASEYAEKFAEAIPVGADFELIKHKFLAWLMSENSKVVEALDLDEKLKYQIVSEIRVVRSIHEDAIRTGAVNEKAATAAIARSTAKEAVWSSTRRAEASAWTAARSAVESLEDPINLATWSAAEAQEWAAELSTAVPRIAAYQRQADKLLQLLREANTAVTGTTV